MKELTKAEEQIMQVLWRLDKGFIKDLLEELPEPKPAYNTVSTIVRILEKKGFISHRAFGKTFEYYPLVTRDDYKKFYVRSFVKRFFGNSFQEMVSFFASDPNMSVSQLEEIRRMVTGEIERQKGSDHE